ncbi:IS110 family transposase [Agromyces sp. NPDC004153]
MQRLWAGIDAGKSKHHCVVIDEYGNQLLSRKVSNDEDELLELLADVRDLAGDGELTWATDLNQGGAALLISVLVAHGQEVLYFPGRAVAHAASTYRGDTKTDAKDAAIIADQARMRRDLHPVRYGSDIAADLRLLTSYRTDLVNDKTRTINRLRAALLEYFPALEAAFDYSRRTTALVLLTRYQTPNAIRSAGAAELAAWVGQHVKQHSVATATVVGALKAADKQRIIVPGQAAAALIVANLASEVLRLRAQIGELEHAIEERLQRHEHAPILMSMPGFGPQLAADFIAATGGTIAHFSTPDRLAGMAGVAPVPRDSGRIQRNHRRPHRYDRRMLRACFLAAQTAAVFCPESRAYYERKRREGKSHKQAVLALARRRMNVIYAMLRDGTTYQLRPAPTATG